MINLDNLKAGCTVSFVVDETDVGLLQSDLHGIRKDQITSISHPPKPVSKLDDLKTRMVNFNVYDEPWLMQLLDILIEKESGE